MPSIKGNFPDVFNDPRVPVIGQPAIHVWTGPQVSITCCCEKKTQLIIAGFNFTATCPHCKRGHMLVSFASDMRNPMEGTLEIASSNPQETNDGKS